jgi:glycerate kinase
LTILIAPDKFKGTLSAREAAAAIARGCRRAYPNARIVEQQMADGGEGSMALLRDVLPLKTHRLEVAGPLKKPVLAEYLLGEGRAYIEVAQACGLQYIPPLRRNPMITTTIGVGMLIDDAIARGATNISLFLGGSATNDCGAGMAGALGYRFFSDRGNDFIPTGDSLGWTTRIDAEKVNPAIKNIRFTAVCDVDNPLLGPDGATYVYASQKGAKPEDLPVLEDHMSRFADTLERALKVVVRGVGGAGAAGGLGAGAMAFLGAELKPGIEVMMEAVGFPSLLATADLVITGEGKIDEQTVRGKVVAGVAKAAKIAGVPVIAVGGVRTVGLEELPDLSAVHTLMEQPGMTVEKAMNDSAERLEEMVAEVLKSRC